MLHQMPAIESFNRIGGTELGPNHVMVCLDQIKASPPFDYAFILAVYDAATQQPVYFVAAEKNPAQDTWGGGSYFLSIYDKPGHMTVAVSDSFADANVFFPEAMRIVSARFGVRLGEGK